MSGDDIYIRVTSVGSCQRPVYYELSGEIPLPKHYYSVKGTIAHRLIEHELSGAEGDISPLLEESMNEANVPEYGRPELVELATKLHDNFHIWKETTDLIAPDEEIIVEERLYRRVAPGIYLTGKPDLRTESVMIDFKSGRKANRKAYRQQLGAYDWLDQERTGLRRLVNVFLGHESKTGKKLTAKDMEIEHKRETINDDMIDFWDLMNRTITEVQMARDGEMPPARRSHLCAFCPYAHICRGFGGTEAGE